VEHLQALWRLSAPRRQRARGRMRPEGVVRAAAPSQLFVGRSHRSDNPLARLPCDLAGRARRRAWPGPAPSGRPRPKDRCPSVPRVLFVAAGGVAWSGLVESLRAQGLAVLVAPDHARLKQVESGAVDLVLLHTEGARGARGPGAAARRQRIPVVVALREARTTLEGFLESGADDCRRDRRDALRAGRRIRACCVAGSDRRTVRCCGRGRS